MYKSSQNLLKKVDFSISFPLEISKTCIETSIKKEKKRKWIREERKHQEGDE